MVVHESRVTSAQERADIGHGPCQCRKQLDRGDHGSGLELSELAVSVPQGKFPTREQRIAAIISGARPAPLLSGGTGTAD